jgi:hypothetical protein
MIDDEYPREGTGVERCLLCFREWTPGLGVSHCSTLLDDGRCCGLTARMELVQDHFEQKHKGVQGG